MQKKGFRLTSIILILSMVIGTWTINGENVLAEDVPASNNALEIANNEDNSKQEGNNNTSSDFAGGSGTKEDPYQINSSEMFRKMESYPGQYFILISDLDLSDSSRIDFEGTFDGNGHTIKISFSEEKGMFNEISESSIVSDCNIALRNDNLSSSSPKVNEFGAVALWNNGLIEKCSVSGSLIFTDYVTRLYLVGSICAVNGGSVEKCRNDADYSLLVKPSGHSVLLLGICSGSGTVKQCLNTGNLSINVNVWDPNAGIFQNAVAGINRIAGPSNTIECANTGDITLNFDSPLTNSGAIHNFAGFIRAEEFESYSYIVPKTMEGTDSCFIAEDVKFSFSTYNVGSGGGVNSKSTTLSSGDVTGTKVKSEAEILEWWANVIASDDNEDETWIPDGKFSITKSGEWIEGKECALSASYSASTPGKAKEEAEAIKWSSSDPSILDVSETISSVIISDTENNHANIQKSFKAKQAGNVTISATAPDGRNTSISVEIQEMNEPEEPSSNLLEYEKYQAYYYSKYISLITDTSMTYSTIEANYEPTDYAIVNILSFGWTQKFGFTDQSKIWETLLLDVLLQRSSSAAISNNVEKDILQFCDTLYDDAMKNDITDLQESITANPDKINEYISKIDQLEGIVSSKAVLEKLMGAATTVGDFLNYYSTYIKVRNFIEIDTKDFLVKMQSSSVYKDIPAFHKALDNVILHLTIDEDELIKQIIAETATDKLVSKVMNYTIETISNILIPGVSQLVDFTKDTTISMLNAILGTGEIAQLNVYLYMLDCIDQAAKEAMESAAKECLRGPAVNYREVNGGLEFITNLSSYGVTICRKWNSVISTDILKRISDKYLLVNRPHYDVVNDYFDLDHSATKEEKNKYVEELCLNDEKYIDSVLRNMPSMARISWYNESGASEDDTNCLVLFYVINPVTDVKTISVSIVPKNTVVSFLELGSKSGYITPTKWYMDEGCTREVESNHIVTDNETYYTKWIPGILYQLEDSGYLSILSMNRQAKQKTEISTKALLKTANNTNTNGKYEIPAFIDGYRVEHLGDDIFAGVSDISYVSLPGTLKTINESAFDSVNKDARISYVEGSVGEKFIESKNYSNTESIKELYFKESPEQMTIGEEIQLELVQKGSCISEDIVWGSSNTKVATVENGKLIALSDGKSVITAQAGGVVASFELTVVKADSGEGDTPDDHEHTYDQPKFVWSEDYKSCTAKFTCKENDDTKAVKCEVSQAITNPTCTTNGKICYSATAIFNNKTYIDTKEKVLDATGHNYEYTDNGEGTHIKTCVNGDYEEIEPHTYQDGKCALCGATELEGHVHEYNEPKFSWSHDYRSCVAIFTCKDGDDQQTIKCVVTTKKDEKGIITYIAEAEFKGKIYSSEYKIENSNLLNYPDSNNDSSGDKAGQKESAGVKTGDSSLFIFWFLVVISMFSLITIVLLIHKKKIFTK